MKTLFDTSVLVQALVRTLGHHSRAKLWLDRAIGGEFEWVVASHTLAELYAVLTALPVSPRMVPGEAQRLIRVNVQDSAQIIALSARDYAEVIDDVSQRGLIGGVVYDALICRAAQNARVKRLLTFNVDHFRRVWGKGAEMIQAP